MLWGALHPVCAHDMGHPASGTWVQAYFLLLAVLPSPGPGWLCPQHCRGLGASERGTLVGLRGEGSKQSSFRQQAEPVLAAHTGARPLLAPPRSVAKSSGALPPPTSGLAEEVSVHRAPGVHRNPPARPDRVRRPSEPRHPHPGVALQPRLSHGTSPKAPPADPVTLLCFKP